MDDGYFWTGTTTIKRTYKDGKLSGHYSITDNIKKRSGSYNYLSRAWTYGAYVPWATNVSGSFVDNTPTGIWTVNSSRFNDNIQVEYNVGVPVGTWKINAGITKFKDGYIVEEINMRDATWGTKLIYTPEELQNLEKLPRQKSEPIEFSSYQEMYMIGGGKWETYIRNYPSNSSNDDIPKTIMKKADYAQHLQLIGNPPEYQSEEFERMKQQDIENFETDSMTVVEEPMAKLAIETLSRYKKQDITKSPFYHIDRDYAELQQILPLHEKYPDLAIYTFKGKTWINNDMNFKWYKKLISNKSNIENKYQNILSKNIQEVMKYGLSEKEAEMYVLKNYEVVSHKVYIEKLLETYQKKVLQYCSETPITWLDVKEYYTYHSYDKKSISLDAVKKFRDDWFLYATSEEYQSMPVKYDIRNYSSYLMKVTEYVRYNREDKEWQKIENQVRKLNPELK